MKVLARLLILMALCACASEPLPPEASHSVRDSAGVEIVESRSPVWDDLHRWRIGDRVLLEIGSVDGPPATTFTAAFAARLSDGRILVADAGARELRYFTPNGEHLTTVGGEGPGPGEFTRLSSIHVLPADTVLAFDNRSGRATIYTESGALVGTVSIKPQVTLVGPVQRQRWAASAYLASDNSTSPRMSEEELGIYTADGELLVIVDTLTVFTYVERPTERGMMGTVLPFGARRSVAADSGWLYFARGDRWEVLGYGPDGILNRIIRRGWTPEPVAASDIDAAVEFARASRRDQPAERRESFVDLTKEAAVASENKPAIQDLRVDGLGNLWVTHWRPMWEEGALQTFSVFGPDGVWLGDLTAPPGIKLTDIGDDYVLVTWTDETEIPYVRLFPLIKN